MNSLHLVAVFTQNTPGQTARLAKILGDAGVNIRWVTIASNGSFGVTKLLVDQTAPAVEALKNKGFMVSLLEVLAVEVANRPGALQTVAECLGREDINLDNCSGFVANDRAVLLIETHEPARARTLLAERGLRLIEREEMLR